ncbi:MAG: hypothetical protein RR315_04710, partial [Oscillospiraceae bacterium]
GFSGDVTHSVLITGGEPEKLVRLIPQFSEVETLPLGKAPENKPDSKDVKCFTAIAGEFFECPILWDYSSVNQNIAGAYSVTGKPQLPPYFEAPTDFKPFTRSVVVMDDKKVDLSGVSFDSVNKCISCHWIYKIPEDAAVRLEYGIDQGQWQEDDKNFINYSKYSGRSITVNLSDAKTKFQLHTDYYFRIAYTVNGQENTSNTLHMRLESWDFLNSQGEAPSFDIGGDRDGGDEEGSKLPDIVQPIPKPDKPVNNDNDNNNDDDDDEEKEVTRQPL